MKKAEITVIIPAYNEEKAIVSTIKNIVDLGIKNDWNTEIIVINDGSKDDTGKIARELGVTVIDHPINGGYGLSLQHGIEASKMPLIAITDADGTYPIDELPHLVKMVLDDGFDMAVIHVLADPCDAMGANIINQVCEFLKKPIEEMTNADLMNGPQFTEEAPTQDDVDKLFDSV